MTTYGAILLLRQTIEKIDQQFGDGTTCMLMNFINTQRKYNGQEICEGQDSTDVSADDDRTEVPMAEEFSQKYGGVTGQSELYEVLRVRRRNEGLRLVSPSQFPDFVCRGSIGGRILCQRDPTQPNEMDEGREDGTEAGSIQPRLDSGGT